MSHKTRQKELTNVTAAFLRQRAFYVIEISICFAFLRRIAIPRDDATVVECLIIHTHFARTAI